MSDSSSQGPRKRKRRTETPPPYRAGGEQPADNGPAWQDVRAQHLVGWMDHATDVTDEVAAQRLALSGGQVLSLEPVLVALLLPKAYLAVAGQRRRVRVSSEGCRAQRKDGLDGYPGGHEQQLCLHVGRETAGQKLPGGPSCQQLKNA